jgi:hypothetical protein
MKTTLIGVPLVIAMVFVVMFTASAEDKVGKVTIEKDRILMRGVKISQDDQKALNDILKRYDKSLYKIEVYTGGTVKKTIGNLNEVGVSKFTESEKANWKASGFSDWVGLVGFWSVELASPTPGAHNKSKSDELVKRLKPILEKYSKK